MQTETFERLDILSQESRQKLNEQIERVQTEARHLRSQARQLRRAQHAEEKKRKKLLRQVALSGKEWSQSVLRRDGAPGAAVNSQSSPGKQVKLERERAVAPERGSRLVDWRDEKAHRQHKQAEGEPGWQDRATHQLRRQGQQLTHHAADWGDETAYQVRRQGHSLLRFASDLGNEITYKLLRQGQYLIQGLADRSEQAARKLHKQERTTGRDIARRRERVARHMHKQERQEHSGLFGRREVTLRRAPGRRQRAVEQRMPGSEVWSTLGFISGLLLAGGVTYWLLKRNFSERDLEEEGIELPSYEAFNGIGERAESEFRYSGQGGTAAVAGRTRSTTSAEPVTRFVGVLSTRQYFPVEQTPDVRDIVFFATESDARDEGFTSAY